MAPRPQAEESRVASKLDELSQALGRKASISDQIATVIRSLIIGGDLNPGDRVVESRIAKQLGVGQPTVREALVALEHQGLVVRKANQGCVVTRLTRQEIAHILKIRAELELLAVELAVENAPDAELDKLMTLTALMRQAAVNKSIEEFFTHDLHFHETLWRLSGNAYLPKLLSQLMVPLLAFLFIRNLRNNTNFDMTDSAQAHVEIVDGILTRNKKKAREIAEGKFQMFADQHMDLFGE